MQAPWFGRGEIWPIADELHTAAFDPFRTEAMYVKVEIMRDSEDSFPAPYRQPFVEREAV